jgi:hypothetical protein
VQHRTMQSLNDWESFMEYVTELFARKFSDILVQGGVLTRAIRL